MVANSSSMYVSYGVYVHVTMVDYSSSVYVSYGVYVHVTVVDYSSSMYVSYGVYVHVTMVDYSRSVYVSYGVHVHVTRKGTKHLYAEQQHSFYGYNGYSIFLDRLLVSLREVEDLSHSEKVQALCRSLLVPVGISKGCWV